jgi:hypothetical protein
MSYKNSGVHPPYNRTKKAFKNGVEAEPERVILYPTSLFTQFEDASADKLEDGDYTVVGPWPERERKWYATLTVRTVDGERKLKVS